MTELLHDLEERLRSVHFRYKYTEIYLLVGITIIVILQILDVASK